MPRKVVIVMNFLEKFITNRPKSRIFDEIAKVYICLISRCFDEIAKVYICLISRCFDEIAKVYSLCEVSSMTNRKGAPPAVISSARSGTDDRNDSRHRHQQKNC